MDGFEFVFSLLGLLLGFSLVEVVAGFGRAVEARVRPGPDGSARTRIGWLSPLLGLFVMFNLVSFWTAAWALRESIPVLYLPMLFGLLVTGAYYFAAALIFPREIGQWDDLDEHYFRVKKWVVAVVAACNLLAMTGTVLAGADSLVVTGAVAHNLLFYGLLAGLFLVPGRRANLVLLILVVAVYPVTSLAAHLL